MSLQDFEKAFGAPAGKALSRLIRPTIAAPEGKVLVWGDWSNIEARGLPWLAKAEARLDMFREIDADPDSPDVYVRAVAGMYSHNLKDLWEKAKAKDKWARGERQKGKIAELALGFAGGPGALQSMAANYGMSFDSEEADEIVKAWRRSNSWAEVFWEEVWGAFLQAYGRPDGTLFPAGRVSYQGMMVGDQVWVVCYLPDGYPLFYRNVKERSQTVYDPFDPDTILEVQRKLSFEGEDGFKYLWRGILVENVTQAACARILRCALLHLDETGAPPVVAHTHDEIVLMTDDRDDAIEAARGQLRAAMLRDPGWLEGLPSGADIAHNVWYSKALEE